MFSWNISTSEFNLVVESSVSIFFDNSNLQEIVKGLRTMNSTVDLNSFLVNQKPDNSFLYKIVASDARIWKQSIFIESGDVKMTFDVSDKWTVNEFSLQRTVRDNAVALLKSGVTKISLTWI